MNGRNAVIVRDAEAYVVVCVGFGEAGVCGVYQRPKALAKYRKEARVVAEVRKRTLVVGLIRSDSASFFKQLGHSYSGWS